MLFLSDESVAELRGLISSRGGDVVVSDLARAVLYLWSGLLHRM